MKHLVFLMVAIAACAALAKTSTPEGWTDDYDAALKRAAAENKLVLADFSGSDWCGWCKKLDKEVFDTEEFRKGATNEYVLLMVDTPQDQELLSEKAKKQNPKLVEKYKVRGFPTVLVLDAKGEVVFQGGYEKGGPKKYLKMLKRSVKEAPDIAKYIKPIEDVLNKYDADMQKDSEAMKDRLEKEFPAPKDELPSARRARMKKMMIRGGEIFFGEIFAKYEPLYDKAFADAKAMKVPPNMELKKLELISRQERSFQATKMAKLQFEARQKCGVADGEGEDEDDDDEDDGDEDDDDTVEEESVPNDGHWHGIAYAESWASCVQTNAVLPTAWKYFTEQFRPYVRRQLMPADEKAFAKEMSDLVDGVARSLWTPFNDLGKPYALRTDFKVAQSLRERGCSNLTVLAFAKSADYRDHMDRRGSMSREQRVPYCAFATNLVDRGASPLLRWLYAQSMSGVRCGNPEKDMLEGLKERPQDLRVVYNLIGNPGCAKEFDPWFGLMAEAEAERSAAWKKRGGGYASSVTEEGWKGFYEHLGKATNLLAKAYALHPEVAETAYAMMEVMAPIDTDEMNRWFDRVLALEVDNRKAWNTLVFHSLPRWGGSVRGLRDLSAVLATITRKDAPFLRYRSAQLLVVAEDEENPKDRSAFFRDPGLRARYLSALRPLVDGEGVDDETAGYARKGIVDRFWEVGEYAEAGREFRELIASAPPRFRLLGMGWGDYFDFILPAFGGPHEKELVALERHYQRKLANVKNPSDEAKTEGRRLLQPLVEKMGELTSAEKRLVYERMASLGVAEPVATDDTWHDLPIEDGFPGWRLPLGANNYWKYRDGVYRMGRAVYEIEWRSPLPSDYELELDVAFERHLIVSLDTREIKKAGNDSVGVPTLKLSSANKKINVEYFCNLWDWKTSQTKQQRVTVAAPDPKGRHKVLILVRNGLTSVSVDGESALDASAHLKDHFVLPRPDSHITIRGQLLDIYGLRYRKVK
jgi:thioredoxin-related protein